MSQTFPLRPQEHIMWLQQSFPYPNALSECPLNFLNLTEICPSGTLHHIIVQFHNLSLQGPRVFAYHCYSLLPNIFLWSSSHQTNSPANSSSSCILICILHFLIILIYLLCPSLFPPCLYQENDSFAFIIYL